MTSPVSGIVLLREAMHGPLASEAEIRGATSALESWLSRTVDRELEPPYIEPSNEDETDNE